MWNTLLGLGSTVSEPSPALGFVVTGCSPPSPSQGRKQDRSVSHPGWDPLRAKQSAWKNHKLKLAKKERCVLKRRGIASVSAKHPPVKTSTPFPAETTPQTPPRVKRRRASLPISPARSCSKSLLTGPRAGLGGGPQLTACFRPSARTPASTCGRESVWGAPQCYTHMTTTWVLYKRLNPTLTN